ncbi:hypothetical protein ACOSP7_021909 [Xanthoceras sorbifolium]
MFINDLLKKLIKHLGNSLHSAKLKVANNSIASSITALNPLSPNSFSIYFFPNSILQVISALRAPTLALTSTAIPERAASFTYSIKRSSYSFLINLKELILTLLSSNVLGRFKRWPASKNKVMGSQEQHGRL